MGKKESTFSNMVLTLFLVSLLASAALGGVYILTEDPIAEAMAAKKNLAIKRVVPEFTNNPGTEYYSMFVDGDSLFFYVAKQGDDTVGIAIETWTTQGFGGTVKLIAGFSPDGTIYNIAVLEHKETPGLGSKMTKAESNWSEQFNGLNPAKAKLRVKKDGGDIDAITASTISSRAYCDAVLRAYNAYMKGKQMEGVDGTSHASTSASHLDNTEKEGGEK